MNTSFSPHFRRSLLYGVLYSLLTFFCSLVCGLLVAQLLNFAVAGDAGSISRYAFLLLGLLLAASVGLFFTSFLYDRAKAFDGQDFREAVCGRMLRGEELYDSPGAFQVRLHRDGDAVCEYYQSALPEAIAGGVILLLSAVLIGRISLPIGCIFFCLNGIQLLPILLYEKWIKHIYNETCEAEELLTGWTLDGFHGAHILKIFRAREWYLAQYRKLAAEVLRWGYRAETVGTIETIVFAAVKGILTYGSYVILGLFVLNGWISIEKLPLLIVLSDFLFTSIQSVFSLWTNRIQFRAARQHFLDSAAPEAGTASPEEAQVILRCEHLSKTFGDRRVLSDVSVTVREGQRVQLLGKNGSGKSTLLRILLGLETADSGRLLRQLPENGIAYCLQESAQTALTVSDLCDALIRQGQVDGDLLKRHLEGFAFRDRDMLRKPLSQLSEGFRKKFFLSAALAKPSQVLILDEPTNHLDRDSVAYLDAALSGYSGTLIVCTHNDLLRQNWDQVIHIEKGGVVHG